MDDNPHFELTDDEYITLCEDEIYQQFYKGEPRK